MGDPILFAILALIAVAAAVGMLTSRNAIHSALYLILNMATLAVLYLVLNAPFLAMVQVTVYAGAIMVLFLFVIMLLGAERLGDAGSMRQRIPPLVLGTMLLIVFGVLIFGSPATTSQNIPALEAGPRAIGIALFQNFVLPFEVTSVLLLVAMIAVVVWQTTKKKSGVKS